MLMHIAKSSELDGSWNPYGLMDYADDVRLLQDMNSFHDILRQGHPIWDELLK